MLGKLTVKVETMSYSKGKSVSRNKNNSYISRELMFLVFLGDS